MLVKSELDKSWDVTQNKQNNWQWQNGLTLSANTAAVDATAKSGPEIRASRPVPVTPNPLRCDAGVTQTLTLSLCQETRRLNWKERRCFRHRTISTQALVFCWLGFPV